LAGESAEALLRSLYAEANPNTSIEQVYARANALTIVGGQGLEELVRLKLVANAKTAQLRESLLATIKAGGAVGESIEECLRNTGLTGWS
jgi:hypothetical protein